MFGITTITFNGYFLGACITYIVGLFVTFFSQGAYSMQMLTGDVIGGLVAVLFTDLVATLVWNIKKSMDEED
jgi:hypothetical protein